MLFPFKSIPLNHPDGFKNDQYKPYDYTLDEAKAPTDNYTTYQAFITYKNSL